MLEYHKKCQHTYEAHASDLRELVTTLEMISQLMETILNMLYEMKCNSHLITIRIKFDFVISGLEDMALAFALHNSVDVLMPKRLFALDLEQVRKQPCSTEVYSDAYFYALHRGQWILDSLAAIKTQINVAANCKLLAKDSRKKLGILCVALRKNVHELLLRHKIENTDRLS
jgi:hypothetical protein